MDNIFDNKTFRYAGVYYDDIANGEGLGCVFFTQYCPHKCKGCHNPSTWSRDGGMEFTEDVFNNIMNYFENTPFADRLTLSGGECLSNLELTNLIASEFKRRFPERKLWIYTGYKFEELLNKPKYSSILEMTDIIVDGKFELDKRDITLAFRGSSNQRIIDVKKSLENNQIILYKN